MKKHNFNPRSPAGSDQEYMERLKTVDEISIHAPLRGATQTASEISATVTNFNPRSPAGSD